MLLQAAGNTRKNNNRIKKIQNKSRLYMYIFYKKTTFHSNLPFDSVSDRTLGKKK